MALTVFGKRAEDDHNFTFPDRFVTPWSICRHVHGLDATAAQSFGTLWAQLRQQGVELLLTHLKSATMKRLLEAHGVIVNHSASQGAGPTTAARYPYAN